MTPHPDGLGAPLQSFFVQRLQQERGASPHTIASYRDTFCLLFAFAKTRLGKTPDELLITDLGATFIGEFLLDLERARHNSARTRNVRLAALHSFFRYLSFRMPRHSQLIQRVLAMEVKRFPRRRIDFLARAECEALLAAPDTRTWIGQRDWALLTVALQTGLRVSELVGLKRQDVDLSRGGAHVRCLGKGRKERCTPLRKDAVLAVRRYLAMRSHAPEQPLFPSSRGGPMSRDAVQERLRKYVAIAARRCPSLKTKRVSPHVLRHSTAMDMLHRGVDRRVIALWLGHESPTTTQMYLEANMELKERAVARTLPFARAATRYQPAETLLAFLKAL